jgi:hypothetical protein
MAQLATTELETENPPLAFGSRPPYQGVKGESKFRSSVFNTFP